MDWGPDQPSGRPTMQSVHHGFRQSLALHFAAFVLSAASVFVFSSQRSYAQGVVQLPVSPGWDFFPPLTEGKVVRSTTGKSTLNLTYSLTGAEPSRTYTV